MSTGAVPLIPEGLDERQKNVGQRLTHTDSHDLGNGLRLPAHGHGEHRADHVQRCADGAGGSGSRGCLRGDGAGGEE